MVAPGVRKYVLYSSKEVAQYFKDPVIAILFPAKFAQSTIEVGIHYQSLESSIAQNPCGISMLLDLPFERRRLVEVKPFN